MKKILSILVCVCVLLSAMVFTASAADGSATISFAPDENRISYSSSQQVWQENGITVTNNQGASTTAVRDKLTDDHIRCYKSSEVIIEYPGMTTIVIDSVTYDDNDYAAPWTNSFDASLGTATVNDGDVTITLNNAVDSLTFATMSGQGRAYSITVYTGNAKPPVADDEEEDKDDTTTSTATLVDTPVAGTAYKLGMIQENKSATDVYFITGAMANTYYFGTTTDVTESPDVYLEEVSGGYNLYTTVDGAKKYINMVVSDSHENAVYQDAAATVYTYDATLKTLVTTLDTSDGAAKFALAGYGTYTTVCPCNIEDDKADFYCHFYTVGADDGGVVTPPAGGEEDTPVELPAPDATNTLTIKEAIELGSAQEHNTYTEEKYYVTGLVISVYNDQYGNMYIVDEEGNTLTLYGTYSADGETSYGEMASKPDEGDTVTIYGKVGQYSGTAQIKNGWIIEFTAGELEVEDTDPAADSVLSIKDAIALGESKLHNVYTENKYYITGTILEVYNEDYGNLYLVDGEGNQITVYGSWNEDGTLSYSQMETKPVAGDTVTLYGIIGQYNGTAQMKNGWFKDAPVVEGDDTTDDATTGGDNNANTDSSTTSPSTGDNVGAVVAMAIAAAAVITYTSKKR